MNVGNAGSSTTFSEFGQVQTQNFNSEPQYQPAPQPVLTPQISDTLGGDVSLYGANNQGSTSSNWTRFWGLAKAAGGALEAAAGAGVGAFTAWTGIGAVAGGAVALHGADTAVAGVRQLFSGEEARTLTSQGIAELTGSEMTGELVDAGVGIIGTAGVGALSGAAKNARLIDKSIVWTRELAAGSGYTRSYGSMVLSKLGSALDRAQVLIHEKVHSFLSPSVGSLFATARASARDFLYENSRFMKYTEEALAETAAQFGTRSASGLTVAEALKTGVLFPLANGYVKGERLATEVIGVAGKIASTEAQVSNAVDPKE